MWLNLELVKKPPECLEYLVVHELIHLLVRHHDERFQALMDRHLPKWRQIRSVLNAAPLASDRWAECAGSGRTCGVETNHREAFG